MNLIFNGQPILLEEFKIEITNRSFLYGDGFFDTILAVDGRAPLLDFHIKRDQWSAEAMGKILPITQSELSNYIQFLAPVGRKRIRVQCWTGDELGYATSNKLQFLISASEISITNKQLQGHILKDFTIPNHQFSWIKSNSSFFYARVASLVAHQNKTEAILMNESGYLIEGIQHSLFWKKKDIWGTHPLKKGGILSVSKMNYLENGMPDGLPLIEEELHQDDINHVETWGMANALKELTFFSLKV